MLTLICGMPRAGKTTYAERYDDVIHLDCLGHEAVLSIVQGRTADAVVEGVYFRAKERAQLVTAYKGNGKQCIWIDTPLEIRKTRPLWTPHHDMNFEEPSFDEGWDEIIIIRGDEIERLSK